VGAHWGCLRWELEEGRGGTEKWEPILILLSHPSLGTQPQSQSPPLSQPQPQSQPQLQSLSLSQTETQAESQSESQEQPQAQSPALLADLRSLLGEMESRLGGFTRGVLQVAEADGAGSLALPAGAKAALDEETGPLLGAPALPEAFLQELHVQSVGETNNGSSLYCPVLYCLCSTLQYSTVVYCAARYLRLLLRNSTCS